MMESNDGILSHREYEITCFFWVILSTNIFRENKKHGCLMKKAAATLRCSEKQVLPKRIKAAIKRCSLKQVF